MTDYRPRRDSRFEYIYEAMVHIEETQCGDCAFSKLMDPDETSDHAHEYPMCNEIEAEFIAEPEVMTSIEDLGDEGLSCKKFRDKTLPDLTVEQPLW